MLTNIEFSNLRHLSSSGDSTKPLRILHRKFKQLLKFTKYKTDLQNDNHNSNTLCFTFHFIKNRAFLVEHTGLERNTNVFGTYCEKRKYSETLQDYNFECYLTHSTNLCICI